MAKKVSSYQAYYGSYIDKLKEKAKSETTKALNNARTEFFKDVKNRVKDMFDDVINEFYNDYTPLYYDRHDSLYNILVTKTGTDYLEISFDPEKMTGFRSGYKGEDGLYDQVFRKGWHGGAASGLNHPDIGTPYWRKPYPEYYEWGQPAKTDDRPPLDEMKLKISDYERNALRSDFMRAWDKHKKNIKF